MTNLEKLLRNDDEVLNFVLNRISGEFCINTETMKSTRRIGCGKCPFNAKNNDDADCCDELEIIWLMEEYSNELHGQDDAD